MPHCHAQIYHQLDMVTTSGSPIDHPLYKLSQRYDFQYLDNICGLAVFYHACTSVCFDDIDGHSPAVRLWYCHTDLSYYNECVAEARQEEQLCASDDNAEMAP